MADMSLPWAGDLSVDLSGDIAVVDGTAELVQRVTRRFLTNSIQSTVSGLVASDPDYVFDKTYGGNARAFVDSLTSPQSPSTIQNLFLNQLKQESGVAQYPPATVTVTSLPNGIQIDAAIALRSGEVVLLPQLEITQ